MPKYIIIRVRKSAYIGKLMEVGSNSEYWIITPSMKPVNASALLVELNSKEKKAYA